ncbi:fibrinogen-like YCDxxxxGGGW domain-containing protein [Aeromonas sp. MrichA-1]|uniref:fibrinogen-like YCDxxxxGGGW domain-containing protein n=1 Tax=Aeromonas sp. MrichA-1 TaxID=2823362 RepID=UPI001B31B261|nr:fibrinogen-like YCDxxxxGGGW domain-containing protein [Aeromonas sp. MrichA-1]MBP4081855.1 hypothetical protein [Aeromonas sp. MrichA-1]
MFIKTFVSVLMITAPAGVGASGPDSQYIIKLQAMGVSEKQNNAKTPENCLSIKKNEPSSKSGVYEISVNGIKLKTYCEMTIDGGGWTQVMVRHQSASTFEFDNNIGERQIVAGKSYSVDDAVWDTLSSSSVHLMMFYDLKSYAYIKTENAKKARCTPLTNTLKRPVLWHNETSGCDWTGLDYSGGGTVSPNAFAFYEFNRRDFQMVVGVSWYNTESRGGMLFVR